MRRKRGVGSGEKRDSARRINEGNSEEVNNG
jgi:hypothetical protein